MEKQLVWRNVCDGKVLLVREADASWRFGRERTPVGCDGDDEQPHALQRMHLQKLITSRVGEGLIENPYCKRTRLPGSGLRHSHTTLSSEVTVVFNDIQLSDFLCCALACIVSASVQRDRQNHISCTMSSAFTDGDF